MVSERSQGRRQGLVAALVLGVLVLYLFLRGPQLGEHALIGKPLPPFSGRLSSGVLFNSAIDIPVGKSFVLNFWTTNCPVCRDEVSELERYYRDFVGASGSQVVFLTVNLGDKPSSVLSFLRDSGASFPALFDINGELGRRFEVNGVPETFLVDSRGLVRHVIFGGTDADTIRLFVERFEKEPLATNSAASTKI